MPQEQKLGRGARKIKLERHLDANSELARKEFSKPSRKPPMRSGVRSPP